MSYYVDHVLLEGYKPRPSLIGEDRIYERYSSDGSLFDSYCSRARTSRRYDLRQTCERILAAHLLNKAPFKSNGGGTNHFLGDIAEGHGFCEAQYGTVCHQHKWGAQEPLARERLNASLEVIR